MSQSLKMNRSVVFRRITNSFLWRESVFSSSIFLFPPVFFFTAVKLGSSANISFVDNRSCLQKCIRIQPNLLLEPMIWLGYQSSAISCRYHYSFTFHATFQAFMTSVKEIKQPKVSCNTQSHTVLSSSSTINVFCDTPFMRFQLFNDSYIDIAEMIIYYIEAVWSNIPNIFGPGMIIKFQNSKQRLCIETIGILC